MTNTQSRVRHRWRMTLALFIADRAIVVPGVPALIAWLLEGVIVEERHGDGWRRVYTAQDLLDRVDPADIEDGA
jgi:hypothetical protein